MAVAGVAVRRARPSDAAAIAAIYRFYVEETRISFELDAPSPALIGERMAKGEDRFPWLVAERDGAVAGYAYAGSFRERLAYRFTVETSVYVARDACGAGVGRALYGPLLEILAAQGFIQAIGAITLPNAASVALHERMGFIFVGRYGDVGHKLGEWASVGLYQKALAPLPRTPAEPLPLSDCAAWATIDR